MFFSNSYSDKGVQISAKWIRFFNDNLNTLLSIHEAKHHSEIIKFFSVQHLGPFISEKKDAAKVIQAFGNGAMMSILTHFFDGKNKEFDKFSKEAIILAFNLGFLMNNGKSMYKNFAKNKMKISDFQSSGEDWANKFLIPSVIKKNLSIEEVEEKFIDNKDSYDHTEDENKVCPFCAETIKIEANKCRYCGEWMNS